MGTYFFPLIRREDFEAFRRVMKGEFPATFEKWHYLRLKEVSDEQGAGQTAVDVQIDPDEFAEFCLTSGASPDRDTLYRFAMRKGLIDHK